MLRRGILEPNKPCCRDRKPSTVVREACMQQPQQQGQRQQKGQQQQKQPCCYRKNTIQPSSITPQPPPYLQLYLYSCNPLSATACSCPILYPPIIKLHLQEFIYRFTCSISNASPYHTAILPQASQNQHRESKHNSEIPINTMQQPCSPPQPPPLQLHHLHK